MKLYRLPNGVWAGTQDGYKALAREGGMDTTVPEPIEVPINPKGKLIDFLNDLNEESRGGPDRTEPDPDAEPAPVAPIQNIYDQFDALPPKTQIELGVRAFDNTEKLMDKLVGALKSR